MFSAIINFFYGWYIDDTRNFWHWFANYIRKLDRTVGMVGNLQNWTSPLFGDYSYIGRLAGPPFRTIRIVAGAAIYAVLTIICLIVYLFWIILPIAVIIMVFLNLLVLVKAPEPVFALRGLFI